MYLPLNKVLSIYDDLAEAKITQKPIKISVYTLKLGLNSGGDELADKKYAEDFHSICHIFSKKHNVDINIDDVDAYKWVKQIRADRREFSGKLKVEVILKKES